MYPAAAAPLFVKYKNNLPKNPAKAPLVPLVQVTQSATKGQFHLLKMNKTMILHIHACLNKAKGEEKVLRCSRVFFSDTSLLL